MSKNFIFARISALLSACMFFGVMAAPLQAGAGVGADAMAMVDSGLNYVESTAMLANPFMGYPNRGYAANGGFDMLDDGTSTIHEDGGFAGGFTWYYIDIKAFSAGNDAGTPGKAPPSTVGGEDKPISQAALDAFEQALTRCRRNGASVFIRFVYDNRGTPGCEPDDFNMAVTHVEQLCAVVGRFPDVVQGFECGIIGVYGEMHGSKYAGREYANRIIDAYLDNTPDSMVLLLRTPGRIADYLGITWQELAALKPQKGSREYRLGLYNDGYMNSDSDLGTWQNRALETDFLAMGHTPYGGEYGSDYPYITNKNFSVHLPQNAIPEMYKTHVSFIRGNVHKIGGKNDVFGYDQHTYGAAYEAPGFPDNAAFYGQDCHAFITAHLGYRFVLRGSELSASPQAGGVLKLRGMIENTGFANALHDTTAELILVKDGAARICGVNLDVRDIKSCGVYNYDFELSLPSSMAAGSYDVYLRISHGADSFYAAAKSGIQFANAGGIFDSALGANKLGTVTIAAAPQPAASASAASGVFAQINNPKAGAKFAQGAPALLGHGFGGNAEKTVALAFNTGDSMTLAPLDSLRSDSAASHQWSKDGVPISAENVFEISDISASDAGAYQLKVTSGNVFTTTTINIAITEHDFSEWVATIPPSCATTGEATRVCADNDCGLIETKILPAIAHDESTEPTPSTCTVRGSIETVCVLCEETLSVKILELAPHSFDIVTEPATCITNGLITRTCAACSHVETEPIAALGHSFDYTITGDIASATCNVCGAIIEPKTFANALPPGDVITAPPIIFGTDPLVVIGEGGFAPSYETKTDPTHITFLFKITGVESAITLAKLRAITYVWDGDTDSNDARNYYGDHLVWSVTEDGFWAYTIARNVMTQSKDGAYFKGVRYAVFFDPTSTKEPSTPINNNPASTIQLLGIYDGSPAYDIVFVDADGNFLERHTAAYRQEVWVNLINRIKTADELYQGATPVKKSDYAYDYAFAGWADSAGNPVSHVLTDVIVHPIFIATPTPWFDSTIIIIK